jgi:quercetin dioxygenase-like cupin family protein
MSAATKLAEKPVAGQPATKRAWGRKSDARYVEGRRSYFKYRELGVTEASNGRMRAQVTSATQGMSRPTGWHYHVCESQLVYMLSGWVDLEFEDGETIRVEAGDSLYIPGGLRHNEIRTSDTFELLEVSVPADMGTVPCDPPAERS